MKTRAACVALSLLAALVIALELFVVKPFFEAWLLPMQVAHNVLLSGGIGVFVVGEVLYSWRCRSAVTRFAKRVKKQKFTT